MILPEHSRKIEEQLNQLVQRVPAQFVLLVDVTGQIVGAKGSHDGINLVMLGSLVAGDLAASQEIARLMGEYQDYQIVLREGKKSHTFIADAGPYLALMVKVDEEIPLGWARMLIQQAGTNLAKIFQDVPSSSSNSPDPDEPPPMLDMLETELDDSFSDLFDEALDDMWLE
jgi:predicted regulator of Ras-like GTPase activity (Roadblock/LC7/MglB family)